MAIQKQNLLIGTSILAGVFFVGWVLPEYPYVKRLSRSKAQTLKAIYEDLYLKNWISLRDSSAPALTKEEVDRMYDIKRRLIRAGYQLSIEINEADNTVISGLEYPAYAG